MHTDNPEDVLKEAKRVSRKNVLMTVPDCTGFYKLKRLGLTYEHMLERDHVNFFTKKRLENLLSRHFKTFKVEEKEPIALGAVSLPWWLLYPISLLYRLEIIKTDIYFGLYTVAEVM